MSTEKWASVREEFLFGYAQIDEKYVDTPKKAAAYFELYSRSLELTEVPESEASKRRLEKIVQLSKKVGSDSRLRLQRLLLEQAVCFSCPLHELAERFLALEKSISNEGSSLGNVWGPIVKARTLYLFLHRVVNLPDVRDFEGSFATESRVLSALFDPKVNKSLGMYFGIADFRHDRANQDAQISSKGSLKGLIRPLVNRGLQSYSEILLPNRMLTSSARVHVALDYVDFLNLAQTRYPDQAVSITFSELVDFLESEADKSVFIHYYLQGCTISIPCVIFQGL
jgi:hypothetical protein